MEDYANLYDWLLKHQLFHHDQAYAIITDPIRRMKWQSAMNNDTPTMSDWARLRRLFDRKTPMALTCNSGKPLTIRFEGDHRDWPYDVVVRWMKRNHKNPYGPILKFASGTRTGRVPETEGRSNVTMTRQQLENLQAAAAKQMADAEAELKKYAKFPTESEVLAVGDVIRYVVKCTWERRTRESVNFHVSVDPDRLAPGNYVIAGVDTPSMKEKVEETYTYVAIHIDGTWYTSGVKGDTTYTYDELLQYFVARGVAGFDVYPSASVVHLGELVEKARKAVARASADLDETAPPKNR